MANITTEDIRLAQESERKYGVPASVTLAQYILESASGTSNLARTKNNYFGMRAGSKGWQSFNSKAESYDAHGKLLAKPLYSKKTSGQTTIEGYIRAFSETYAPASDGNNDYAGHLIKIINDNNLNQYNVGTWQHGGTYDASVESSTDSTGSAVSIADNASGYLSKFILVIAIAFLCILAFVFMVQSLGVDIGKAVKIING